MRTWEARERALAAALAQVADGLDTHDISPNDDAQAELIEEQLHDAILRYAHCIVRDRLKKSAKGDSLVAAKLTATTPLEMQDVLDQVATMEFTLREIAQLGGQQGSEAVELALKALPPTGVPG